ncbi:uncharacterized protein LOC125090530 [Lutra lutra]|uniref:uncharacterized protein LOC125090530 n=1 Tax=Lutra lutra TaxID=9657 RepID=UPI001FD60907|nr:uncharacterized protein LOC125090530 [Lutra lutra]
MCIWCCCGQAGGRVVAQTPSCSHVSRRWGGGGSQLENGGPLWGRHGASGASSPGVSGLGALSVFKEKRASLRHPRSLALGTRVWRAPICARGARRCPRAHAAQKAPWWGERVQPEPVDCAHRCAWLGRLARQARREVEREHVQRHTEMRVLRGSRGLWGGTCPREGSQQGDRRRGVQGELTAEPLVRQEDGHLLPAERTRLRRWRRGPVRVSPSWRAVGKRQRPALPAPLRNPRSGFHTAASGMYRPRNRFRGNAHLPGACVLLPRLLPCGAREDSHMPACLSPGADGSVAASLEGLPGSRGQLPACWSPSLSGLRKWLGWRSLGVGDLPLSSSGLAGVCRFGRALGQGDGGPCGVKTAWAHAESGLVWGPALAT